MHASENNKKFTFELFILVIHFHIHFHHSKFSGVFQLFLHFQLITTVTMYCNDIGVIISSLNRNNPYFHSKYTLLSLYYSKTTQTLCINKIAQMVHIYGKVRFRQAGTFCNTYKFHFFIRCALRRLPFDIFSAYIYVSIELL